MDSIKITEKEFNEIQTNYSGLEAADGLVIKKESAGDWYLLTYKLKEDKEFEIDVKKIVII